MTPFATWILIPPLPQAHPNIKGRRITSARSVAKSPSIRSQKSILAKQMRKSITTKLSSSPRKWLIQKISHFAYMESGRKPLAAVV